MKSTKNLQLISIDPLFSKAIGKLSRTTGSDLDSVELAYESAKIDLKVYGYLDQNYEANVEALYNDGGLWIDAPISQPLKDQLRELLEEEVEKVYRERAHEEGPDDDYDVRAEQGLYGYGY